MTWKRAFEKCIFHNFLETFLLYVTGLWIFFCKFANFLKIKKVEHKSFPMMYVSFVILGYQTLDLKGESITPPPPPSAYPMGLKYPSRDTFHANKKDKTKSYTLLITCHQIRVQRVLLWIGPSLNARSLRLILKKIGLSIFIWELYVAWVQAN